ncbi:MAG: glycoside hydrolase family 2 protein, partial [Bacteroidales bacterium]|nr:glycoside hydrolase family 2 protein [Bacteroidales bacterium]
HGKMVERAGPGGEGDVIDHFSGKAVSGYLNHFSKAFENYKTDYLRGFFNDSYEVDDASGQADWTDDLFYEFYVRRGYDLRNHLPALFQKDEPDKNKRVLSDYRQTISDLLLERFTATWTSWAHRQGKTTRNQAHGSPGNILDLYAASDIPETEGSEITRFRFASSAANVTGKPLVSCEAATWLNEHFLSSLSDVKKVLDLFFLSGINHVLYHGTCFSPENEPWPGFLFYAATEFTPSNPLWNDFSQLNNYVARVQSFLQKGWPDNEIIIYYPVFDRFAEYGRGMLEHFDALSPAFNDTRFKDATEMMIRKGYAFDYISDLQLSNTEAYNGLLETEGNSYRTLIVPQCKYIPLETFWQILNLAKEGAYIIFYGEMPENVSGFANLDERNEVFSRLRESIKFTNSGNIMRATFGEGTILLGNDLDALLSYARIRREAMTDYGIMFTRRGNDSGTTYFVSNQGEKQYDGWLPLSVNASTTAFFNPCNGQFGTAKTRSDKTGKTEVYLRLAPGETMIIDAYNRNIAGKPYLFYDKLSPGIEIKGSWKIEFTSGGPVLPSPAQTDRLVSWTLLGGEDVKNFSGTAVYSIRFERPSGKADGWLLNLGRVCESARVSLNGEEIAVLIGPDFTLMIDRKKLKAENLLEIKVSNLMANRIAWMDRNNIEWKKFYNVNMAARMKQNSRNGVFDASSWEPRESGLLGPVTLTPVKIMK